MEECLIRFMRDKKQINEREYKINHIIYIDKL